MSTGLIYFSSGFFVGALVILTVLTIAGVVIKKKQLAKLKKIQDEAINNEKK